MSSVPFVSVVMVTYNHERFLAQALDSILEQKVAFPYEIVVGEDCSTDGTREILKSYAAKHPDVIRPIYHEHNVGMQPNAMAILKKCRGKYLAALEGDDYWCDSGKLQLQVDFLENNPGHSGCCHNAIRHFTHGNRPDEPVCTSDQVKDGEDLTFERLLEGNIIPTCSIVRRWHPDETVPDWLSTLPMGDWPMNLLAAHTGPIRYWDRPMAVYRIHNANNWYKVSDDPREKLEIEIKQARGTLQLYETIDAHFQRKHHKQISHLRARQHLELGKRLGKLGRRKDSIQNLLAAISLDPCFDSICRRETLAYIFWQCLPFLHKRISNKIN